MVLTDLESEIEELAAQPVRCPEALALLAELRQAINRGEASVLVEDGADWRIRAWVKKGILLHAIIGGLGEAAGSRGVYWDLDTFPVRRFLAADRVRVVAGALVRDGVCLGAGSAVHAGASIAMGAHLGVECQIDAGCQIGLCARLGRTVLLEAGSRVGGVLNPAEKYPVVIGDESVLCMGCAVMGSVELGRNTLVGPGVQLSDVAGVWDATQRVWLHPDVQGRLRLPDNAVLLTGVPPARPDAAFQPVATVLAGFAAAGEPAAMAYRRIAA